MKKPSKPDSVQGLLQGQTDQNLVDKIESLENQLSYEKDARREDRFLFVVGIMIFLNILFLKDASNLGVPIIVLILQLVFLIVVAKRMGSEQLTVLLDRVLDSVAKKQK